MLSSSLSSVQSETTILGAMLVDPVSLLEGVSALRSGDFSLDSHQRIFSVISALANANQPVDEITVGNELRRRGEMDSIGGVSYLASLTIGIPHRLNPKSYIKTVLDCSLASRGVRMCLATVSTIEEGSVEPEVALNDLARDLIEDRRDDSTAAADLVNQSLGRMDNEGVTIIPTGIRELDEITQGGIRTKELWMIGALPSRGKSALARQIERSAIRHEFRTHVHSVEVPQEEWLLFHIARVAGIPSWKLRQPQLMSVVDRGRMQEASEKIKSWPVRYSDSGTVHINQLIARSRLSCLRYKTKLFIIDYLQLLDGDEREIRIKMGNIARRLKQFAKDYDAAVILLSQLSRKGDINIRPTMQDLKESGDLEAAADLVLLNYRPVDREREIFTGDDELIVAKQRNGPIGTLPMRFNPETLCFEGR